MSVRLTIANYETLVANATRRALRNGEDEAVPRVSDLQALVASTQGKVEIESLEEGREEILLGQLVSASVLLVFRRRVRPGRARRRWSAPSRPTPWSTPATICRPRPTPGPSARCRHCPHRCSALTGGSEDPGVVASALEFLLEGLHLTKRLNKEAAGARATYRGRG